MSGRWEAMRRSPNANSASGVEVTATRKGIEVFGWYDHYVGNDEVLVITWDTLDRMRHDVEQGISPAVKR